MKELIVNEKTGFSTILPFKIFDSRGIEFYNSEFTNHIKNGKRLLFNLPVGKYTYDGFFQKLNLPVKFDEIKLPPKERNLKPKRYKIEFGDNPNKCSVYHNTGKILFDNVFKNASKYILYDIYFHEVGHQFYKTEKFADLYAAKKMLELGFNPSQIATSKLISLSHFQSERKDFIKNNLYKKQNGHIKNI